MVDETPEAEEKPKPRDISQGQGLLGAASFEGFNTVATMAAIQYTKWQAEFADLPSDERSAAIIDDLIGDLEAMNGEAELSGEIKTAIADMVNGSANEREFGKRVEFGKFDDSGKRVEDDLLTLLMTDEALAGQVGARQTVDGILSAADSIGFGTGGWVGQMMSFFSGGRVLDPDYTSYYTELDRGSAAIGAALELATAGYFDDPRMDGEAPSYGAGPGARLIAGALGVPKEDVQSVAITDPAAFFASDGTAPVIYAGGKQVQVDFKTLMLPEWEEQPLNDAGEPVGKPLVTFTSDADRDAFCQYLSTEVANGTRDPEELYLAVVDWAAGQDGVATSIDGKPDPANYREDLLAEANAQVADAFAAIPGDNFERKLASVVEELRVADAALEVSGGGDDTLVGGARADLLAATEVVLAYPVEDRIVTMDAVAADVANNADMPYVQTVGMQMRMPGITISPEVAAGVQHADAQVNAAPSGMMADMSLNMGNPFN